VSRASFCHCLPRKLLDGVRFAGQLLSYRALATSYLSTLISVQGDLIENLYLSPDSLACGYDPWLLLQTLTDLKEGIAVYQVACGGIVRRQLMKLWNTRLAEQVK
jgi:hypothetical protein